MGGNLETYSSQSFRFRGMIWTAHHLLHYAVQIAGGSWMRLSGTRRGIAEPMFIGGTFVDKRPNPPIPVIMQYHAPTERFTISPEEMKRASYLLRYAIANIRTGAGLDKKGYRAVERPLDWAEYAEGGILDAAKSMGLHLGAEEPGKLDVSSDS